MGESASLWPEMGQWHELCVGAVCLLAVWVRTKVVRQTTSDCLCSAGGKRQFSPSLSCATFGSLARGPQFAASFSLPVWDWGKYGRRREQKRVLLWSGELRRRNWRFAGRAAL